MEINYKQKYFKYKNKYLELKNKLNGGNLFQKLGKKVIKEIVNNKNIKNIVKNSKK